MNAANAPSQIDQRLTQIRGGARRRSPSVRALAAFATHADCNLATLGFAARVDFDRLLEHTKYETPFGQSPFAFQRGLAFERLIQDHGYAATLDLLRTKMAFAVADARIINLRDAYPKNAEGMRLRANETRLLVRQLISGDPNAPNLIDGAVLQTTIGGIPARFEADALAARFGGPIHAGEVKSFPVVDGRADQDKLAAAFDQVAIYILLAKQLVDEVGGDADLVSTTALLITPMNVGLKPTLSTQDVNKRIGRVQRLLAAVPDVGGIAASVPQDVTFGTVADLKASEQQRVDALHDLAERIGTTYSPSCLSTCGNAVFCRERSFRAGEPCITGPEAVRLLPGVRTLQRAAELVDGAPPSRDEAAVAPHLARAGRLYDSATGRWRVLSGSKVVGGKA
jgi:hypothetical protein